MPRDPQLPQFVRTLRVRNVNRVGVLASVISAIADGGASVGDVRLIASGPTHVIRDIEVVLGDLSQLAVVLEKLHGVTDTSVLEVRDEVLMAHAGGKLKVVSKLEVHSVYDLGRIYTPGVGEVCRRIYEQPAAADLYTMIANTVAIVSDGSAVLGLGNLGPVAAMPVLEGKAALLAQLVDANAIPIALAVQEPQAIVNAVAAISPTFGVIQLEDIASPKCFEVESTLQERLSTALFHDDQHGTASVVLAALINACRLTDRNLHSLKVGQIGLGAAGLAIARTVMTFTGKPVYGADRVPDAVERLVRAGGVASTIDEIMGSCDVVVATTGVPNLIPPEAVRPGTLVFGLSNPRPEIEADDALAAGAAVAANGRSINNLLCYPGMCRGLLDSGAARATPSLFLAATESLVRQTPSGQLLPDPLSREVHAGVARAVVQAAVKEGLAQRQPPPSYFEEE